MMSPARQYVMVIKVKYVMDILYVTLEIVMKIVSTLMVIPRPMESLVHVKFYLSIFEIIDLIIGVLEYISNGF